jgi:hypothetical protein
MKRLFYGISAVLFTCFMVSCGSTGSTFSTATPPAPREESVPELEVVYKNYEGALIMDGAVSYTVVKGDTLSEITAKNYGESNLYFFPVVMLASYETTVSDPDLIEPGMVFTIPDLQKNLNNPGARGKIKSYLADIAVVYDKKNKAEAANRLRNLAATL